ncbi:hypothetical protein PHYBLDRAFT_60034 [Phycomyces blakesleeanus NRRL 1555(-)]|uniref:Uncharacterized protein n=1 Tax=Phycomyces blakesleeanus (strain ATCC 8743b / DSM 1359 / FGSC 10004 / NBRC 33097 / NRRL 1555) TaxID=763407 RepID=A0A167LCG9_PHYB8|nr:hypothetical protein PHYBLDRAFT_60034 [Phycomyces blakesleeanus NRRL 1555(-)]OAD70135.1 hypothetical protein PHYBLDRAFT_60034 [Phycomyces blakesleeanus NRRL 1555(-)]|eukprot:XP_018288175.1 hypothetical protein PHYBLDRAFT_60034 [Phycomyces blakesleeanus NRRL 1555(-)]
MSAIFLYEDGQGKIYDQSGNNAMNVEEDVNPYHLETLTNIRHYCESQGPEQESLIKDLDTRMEDVANLLGTLYNAAKSGRLAGGIAERAAQKWAKRLKENKYWNILEKQANKVNRKTSQLQEEHKVHLINFYDEHPQARVSDGVASLTEKFKNFTLKNSSVQVFLKNECNLLFKRIIRHPVARNNELKLANRKAWV